MVIFTAALVVACPDGLLATAVSEWLPLESIVVFNDRLKGAAVTAEPYRIVAVQHELHASGIGRDAGVETVTVPKTVAPPTGEVIEIVGAVALETVKIIVAALVAVCPAESLATAVSEWLPLVSVAVFREKLNGALVAAALNWFRPPGIARGWYWLRSWSKPRLCLKPWRPRPAIRSRRSELRRC